MTRHFEHRAAAASILDVIGGTPTLELRRVSGAGASVFAKLELFSPNSSSADRLAAALLDRATASGVLGAGAPVIDAGPGIELGLAMICRMRGHPFTAVLPEGTSLERSQLLLAYGAKVERSPFEASTAGASARARALAQSTPGAYLVAAAEHPLALEVHARTTAPELLATVAADGGRIDVFGMGVGSGATFTATARALRQAYPGVRCFTVTPAKSPHRLEGLSASNALLDASLVDLRLTVTDEQAWALRARLGREEGLLLGLAGAASVWGALQVAKTLPAGARVYTVCADSGERAFSLAEQL